MLDMIRGILLSMVVATSATAQHDWQAPKALKPKAELQRIIGPLTTTEPSRPIHVLWVWGFDEWHKPGAHDYERVRDLMVGLLRKVPKVTAESVYGFPTREQFDKADLVCMFLHLPQLSDEQYAHFAAYIEGGGGVVSIHETCIVRPSQDGLKLAQCLGRAWDEGRSQWGAIFADLSVDNAHEIFKGFPNKVRIVDEFYWDLHEKAEGVSVLARVKVGPPEHSRAPLAFNQLSQREWPVAWTHTMGKGRVFATSTGHNTFSYYDPELRIVLFRAMAWAIREHADPFMPLVFDGITNGEGKVGTTDAMRNWKGKRRGP